MLTRRTLLGSAFAATAAGLYAPRSWAAVSDTLRFASAAGGPRMTDPNQTTQGSDNWAVIQMFEYLVMPPDGKFGVKPEDFEPWLAESWTTSDDAKTWVFKLRPGVQFHKGFGEMTAEDVARTFIRARDEGVQASTYTNLADVQASGTY
jgi:peptide/nickel transport system substrate-binding protein